MNTQLLFLGFNIVMGLIVLAGLINAIAGYINNVPVHYYLNSLLFIGIMSFVWLVGTVLLLLIEVTLC